MGCPVCGNTEAVEDLSFGGGVRFYCAPCGGHFRISSSLDAIQGDKTYDVERTRERLEADRARRRLQPQDPNRLQDLEPALSSADEDLLTDPD